MFCKRCGNPLKPEDLFCGRCGLSVEQKQQAEQIQLNITPMEAANGCQKIIHAPGLCAPMRITLLPGAREGQKHVIRNAVFLCEGGRQENRPLYVTVHIVGTEVSSGKPRKKRKWWIPVVAVLAVLIVIGVYNRIQNKKPQNELPLIELPQQATEILPNASAEEEAVQIIIDDVNDAQQQWTDKNGYTQIEDLEESLDAVCQVLEEAEPVTYYEKNEYCVYFECQDGYGYMYAPRLEEYALNGETLKIVTVQPYFTENLENDTRSRYDHYALDENAAQIRDQYAQWDFYDVGIGSDDNVDDLEISIERMLSLRDYKLILWQGHGSYSESTGYCLCTEIKVTDELREKYKDYFTTRQLIETTSGTVFITEKFFQKNFDEDDFEGAILYIGTCLSGYTRNFAQTLLDKGAAAVYVNSDTIYRDYNLNMLRAVGQSLCWGDTVTQALENAKALHGATDSVEKNDGTYTDVYVYCLTQDWAKDATLQQIADRLLPQPAFVEAYTYVLTEVVSWQAGEDIIYNNYTLYDIDLDGTPECIIELGSSEADSNYVVYTVMESEPVYLGMFSGSHSVLYGERHGGLTVMSGHMGSETCRTVNINDGVFSENLLYMAEVDPYWDTFCDVRPLQCYGLNDLTGMQWEGNPGYDNWDALEPARARVFP